MGGSKLQKFLAVRHIQTPLGPTTGLASSTRLSLNYIHHKKPNALPEVWATFTVRKHGARVDNARKILQSVDDENFVTREPEAVPINIHMDELAVQASYDQASRLRVLTFDPDDHALEQVILSRSAYDDAVEAERQLVADGEKQQSVRELVTSHTFKWLLSKSATETSGDDAALVCHLQNTMPLAQH
ncbi:hypothetical protein, variant [Aphanomyces astaci]|uniref:Uncharacterized protein n=1 Tax=Aphanomyces astaci TaxID=112090 RepID=W4GIG0_APHAT|nr:hypothetical protein H257_07464 [Aphanomyces astaci]XP_009831304.1 hypothetical protein, variant [Aphanomyces astaci]ETV79462.1 hypothetical protein H257_07464 [Aphanomyces astaci]ETV79463.1 hypothetical protein, variant [Aphanomyces astaci]|eukprot:XP_009831303.1 hypothetical protein H257_07464 [Aphanomyces astaci]